MKPQIISANEAAGMIKEHDRILFGGFLACGVAQNIIDKLYELNTQNIHFVCITTDYPEKGVGKLIANKQVKSVQTTHISTNVHSQTQYTEGAIKIEFNPQGTLMERVRAAGAGLGGILTTVGMNTIIADERETIEVDGKQFFLETPIEGKYAIIRAHKADKNGNLIYDKTARNSNPIMSMTGKITIAEIDEIVEVGELDPEAIITPGIFVNYLVVHKD